MFFPPLETEGDDANLGEAGVRGDLVWDENDEIEGLRTVADGDVGEFGAVSPPVVLDLRVEGKARVKDRGRGFPALGVEAPDPETGDAISNSSTSITLPLSPSISAFPFPFLEMPPFDANFSSEPDDPKLPFDVTFLLSFDCDFKAAANTAALDGCRQELEALGLGAGDCPGDTPGDDLGEALGEILGDEPAEEDDGERRGEGSGNNSFSSSSAIGEALRIGKSVGCSGLGFVSR